ncbi:MAG: hypothetical protein EBU96_01220 [Actinobacteria bacterium]|nr:hypothetical protein [Actinomycetota bacterium]
MLGNQAELRKTDQASEGQKFAPEQVVFPVPNGFVPPQGVQPGESFEAIARVKFLDGKMVLEALEGAEVRNDVPLAPPQKPISFENAVERGLSANEGMA